MSSVNTPGSLSIVVQVAEPMPPLAMAQRIRPANADTRSQSSVKRQRLRGFADRPGAQRLAGARCQARAPQRAPGTARAAERATNKREGKRYTGDAPMACAVEWAVFQREPCHVRRLLEVVWPTLTGSCALTDEVVRFPATCAGAKHWRSSGTSPCAPMQLVGELLNRSTTPRVETARYTQAMHPTQPFVHATNRVQPPPLPLSQ